MPDLKKIKVDSPTKFFSEDQIKWAKRDKFLDWAQTYIDLKYSQYESMLENFDRFDKYSNKRFWQGLGEKAAKILDQLVDDLLRKIGIHLTDKPQDVVFSKTTFLKKIDNMRDKAGERIFSLKRRFEEKKGEFER